MPISNDNEKFIELRTGSSTGNLPVRWEPASRALPQPDMPNEQTDFRLAFSPSDCQAYLLLPIYDGTRIVNRYIEPLGEVVLFSLSSHRDKFPVSRLGRMLPVGFTGGRRTVAGSIGIVLWDKNAFRRISQRLYESYQQFVAEPHADEFPPFDLALVFVNEMGNTVSITLYGVTLLDEGVALQTDDVRSVVTLSYMAVDYEIDNDPLEPRRETGYRLWEAPRIQVSQPAKEIQVDRYHVEEDTTKSEGMPLLPTQRPSGAGVQRLSREDLVAPTSESSASARVRAIPNIVAYVVDFDPDAFRQAADRLRDWLSRHFRPVTSYPASRSQLQTSDRLRDWLYRHFRSITSYGALKLR